MGDNNSIGSDNSYDDVLNYRYTLYHIHDINNPFIFSSNMDDFIDTIIYDFEEEIENNQIVNVPYNYLLNATSIDISIRNLERYCVFRVIGTGLWVVVKRSDEELYLNESLAIPNDVINILRQTIPTEMTNLPPNYSVFEPIPAYRTPVRSRGNIRVGDLPEDDPIRQYIYGIPVLDIRTGNYRPVVENDYISIADLPTEEELREIINQINNLISTPPPYVTPPPPYVTPQSRRENNERDERRRRRNVRRRLFD